MKVKSFHSWKEELSHANLALAWKHPLCDWQVAQSAFIRAVVNNKEGKAGKIVAQGGRVLATRVQESVERII